MRLLWVTATVLLLAGCAEPSSPEMDRMVTQVEGQFSGHSFPPEINQIHGVLITNQTQWESFWPTHMEGVAPEHRRPVPDVDFSERFVAALFLGDRNSTGFQLGVTGLSYEADEYVLSYSVGEPGPGCEVALIPTQPNDIVAIDRVHGQGPPALRTELDEHIVQECGEQQSA